MIPRILTMILEMLQTATNKLVHFDYARSGKESQHKNERGMPLWDRLGGLGKTSRIS